MPWHRTTDAYANTTIVQDGKEYYAIGVCTSRRTVLEWKGQVEMIVREMDPGSGPIHFANVRFERLLSRQKVAAAA